MPPVIAAMAVVVLNSSTSGTGGHTRKWQNVRCEIEDFVETHVCKLRGTSIARTNGFMGPHQEYQSLLRGTKSDSCGTHWMYKSVAVDMYATLLVDVICVRGDKWSYITRWIGQTIIRNRTQHIGMWNATSHKLRTQFTTLDQVSGGYTYFFTQCRQFRNNQNTLD